MNNSFSSFSHQLRGSAACYAGEDAMPQRDTSAVEVALNGLHAVIIDSQHAVANLGERLGPVSKGRAPDTTKGGTLGGGNCPALCKVEERISDATNLIRMLHQELVTLRESLCI